MKKALLILVVLLVNIFLVSADGFEEEVLERLDGIDDHIQGIWDRINQINNIINTHHDRWFENRNMIYDNSNRLNDHENRIVVLETSPKTGSIYLKYLSIADRKKMLCGYGEEVNANYVEDTNLGLKCDIKYRTYSSGRVRARCSCTKL